MLDISKEETGRISEFINSNDLDYEIIDNGIIRYHVKAYDNMIFYFYNYNGEYVIVKYDKTKDNGNPGSMAYEYFNFKNLQQVLEQLKIYDDQIHKQFWYTTTNSAEIGFNKDSYVEDWFKDFQNEEEYWKAEDDDNYKYLTYNNTNCKPQLKSPYNTLHEVSPINDISYTQVDKLYFEIHPISCQPGNESYLLKLLCNNEEVLKEFINYIVVKKKGLSLLIKNIFDSIK